MHFRSLVRNIGPGIGFALLLFALGSCSLLSHRKDKDSIPIPISLDAPSHRFLGMGANVPITFYNRRTRPLQVLNDLRISYIRVKRTEDNWNDIAALRAATFRLKIKWIYSLDNIPLNYLNSKGRLFDTEGFANWWAEEVDELNYQEVPADLIELIDNPELLNSGTPVLNSDGYNELLHATRRELDLRDYQNVGIIGPGLSTLSTEDSLETWYMDLDQPAFEMLKFWSGDLNADTASGIHLPEQLANFRSYLNRIESLKPIFITSYANRINQYGPLMYPDPNRYDILGNRPDYERYYYSASFSMPYALQVYTNTLNLLSQPEVIPFVHQLFDAPDDVKFKKRSWGLLDLNGTEKPVYRLLSALFSRVPKDAEVVPIDFPHALSLSGLVFYGRQKVILTICNQTAMNMDLRLVLKGATGSLSMAEAMALLSPEINHPDLGRMDDVTMEPLELKLKRSSGDNSHSLPVTMRSNSVFIAELEMK
jgi:hypothetical protein